MQSFQEFKILKESYSSIDFDSLNLLSKQQIAEIIKENSINELKIYDWLKDKIQKSGKWLLDNVKFAIKSVKDLINKISKTIKDFLKRSWNFINSEISKELNKDREIIEDKVKTYLYKQSDKQAIESELKQFGYVVGYLTSYFTMDVSDDIYTAVNDIEDDNIDNQIKESVLDLILEDSENNFFKILGDKIDDYPPFTYLQFIKKISTKAFNSFANLLSVLSDKLGGPGPFDFVYIGMILGIIVENIGESLMTMTIVDFANMFTQNSFEYLLIMSIPGILLCLKVFKTISAGIWLIGSVEMFFNLSS